MTKAAMFLIAVFTIATIAPAPVTAHQPDLSECEQLRLELFDAESELTSAYMGGVFAHSASPISLDEGHRRLTAFGKAAEKFMLAKSSFWFCVKDALFWDKWE